MAYKANRVGVRELRVNLRAHIYSGKVVQIGTPWHLRAVLVSVAERPMYDRTAYMRAITTALSELRAVLESELE